MALSIGSKVDVIGGTYVGESGTVTKVHAVKVDVDLDGGNSVRINKTSVRVRSGGAGGGAGRGLATPAAADVAPPAAPGTTSPVIYLASAGDQLPDLKTALAIHFRQSRVNRQDEIQIIELNDANADRDAFTEQPIFDIVKSTVTDGMGYNVARAKSYKLFEEATDREVDHIISAILTPGTICIAVGGNSFRLASAFGRLPGVRAAIEQQVKAGAVMYVSFSAGTVMAGLSVKIARDDPDEVVEDGGILSNQGFGLVPYAMRPHNQSSSSQQKGLEFEEAVRRRQIKDDNGNVLQFAGDGPVLYLNDGQAWLFAEGGKRLLGR